MDSSTPAFDNPLTLPIRRGQPVGYTPEEDESLIPEDLGDPEVPGPDNIEPEPATDPAQCPRCKGKLVNPQELGWCPKCGYCRSLEKDKATAQLVNEVAPKKSALNRFGEIGEIIGKIPSWGWIAAGGICVVVALASAANRFLPEQDSLARALIGLIGIVVSLVTILFVNLWSLFQLGAGDEHVGPKDIFFPLGLWRKICLKLPASRIQFWTITWCLTAFISAIFIVGGFDYWWEKYKPKRVAKSELLSAAGALAQGADDSKSLTESVEDLAKKQELANPFSNKKKNEEGKITTQCVIVGYTIDGDQELTGVVVGALLTDRVRFAGIVRKGFTPKQSEELLAALKPLIQPKSYIPGLSMSNAIWVKPEVFCEVEHLDFDKDQHFISPQFKNILSGK